MERMYCEMIKLSFKAPCSQSYNLICKLFQLIDTSSLRKMRNFITD